jgi:hypothetical protein
MGFSIAFPNLSIISRNPHAVALRSAEGAALLTALGSTARLVEDVPNLPSRNPHPVTLHSAEGAALLMPKAALAEDGYLLAPGSVEVDLNLQYHVRTMALTDPNELADECRVATRVSTPSSSKRKQDL